MSRASGTLPNPRPGPGKRSHLKGLALKTVTLAISGMTCGLCPITVCAALKHVPGVKSARAATVTYDPRRTDVSASG